MAEQKKSGAATTGTAIRWVVALAGLGLLAAKGLGAGISWLTILGVLAIPGALSVVGIVLAIPLLLILGIASAGKSSK